MSLIDAVKAAGIISPDDSSREVKKAYSEQLSKHLAYEVAGGLREVGFPVAKVKPLVGGKGEKEFQGGLGPKKVDVSYSDDQHGLILAVSIKSICFRDLKSNKFGKNLKNRFGDLCTEAITLHMRFPYSVVTALFAFPVASETDHRQEGTKSTFSRATELMRTISGRREYTDPGEKFENVTMMLFAPVTTAGTEPWVKLFNCDVLNLEAREVSEQSYFQMIKRIYNTRNPHAVVGSEPLTEDSGDDDDDS